MGWGGDDGSDSLLIPGMTTHTRRDRENTPPYLVSWNVLFEHIQILRYAN